jgi:hypothetical protein
MFLSLTKQLCKQIISKIIINSTCGLSKPYKHVNDCFSNCMGVVFSVDIRGNREFSYHLIDVVKSFDFKCFHWVGKGYRRAIGIGG